MRSVASAFAGADTSRFRAVAIVAMASLLSLVLVAAITAPAHADAKAEEFERDIKRLEAEQQQARAEADRLARDQQAAREEQRRLDEELQAATDHLAELEAELARLTDAASVTAREVASLVDRRARQRLQLGQRARALYQLGGLDPVLALLSGASNDDLVDTAHYVSALSHEDQETIEAFAATTTRLNRRQADLAADREDVTQLQAEVEAAREELSERMAEAVALEERLASLEEQALANLAKLEKEERKRRQEERARLAEIERKRREEAARKAREEAARREAAQRAAAEAAARKRAASQSRQTRSSRESRSGGSVATLSTSGKVCPQARPRSFSNDWGAPRSGGRRHQGTDVFGRMGGDVYAITSGTIQFTKVGPTAGLFLSLRGDDGNTYWYMHLSSFGARPGQRVSAGQRIGANGDTGNAKGTPPHIHFEYHPGGGGPVNPYPLLRSIC